MSGLHTGFRVAPQSTVSIRRMAWNARQAFAIGEGRIDLEHFLERMIDYGIVVDVFDSSDAPVGQAVEACWVPESRTLYIRDTVYANACRGGTRAVFTICHEIGHIILAHKRTINRERPGRQIPVYENSEWQADTFGAEFAMPLPVINQFRLDTPGAIARHFGVSRQAAEVRIEKLVREATTQKR